MIPDNKDRIKKVWNQNHSPVIYRRGIGYPYALALQRGKPSMVKTLRAYQPTVDYSQKTLGAPTSLVQ